MSEGWIYPGALAHFRSLVRLQLLPNGVITVAFLERR